MSSPAAAHHLPLRPPFRARDPQMSSSSTPRFPSIATLLHLPHPEKQSLHSLSAVAAAAPRAASNNSHSNGSGGSGGMPHRPKSQPAIHRGLSKNTSRGSRGSLRNGIRGTALGAAVRDQVNGQTKMQSHNQHHQTRNQENGSANAHHHHHNNNTHHHRHNQGMYSSSHSPAPSLHSFHSPANSTHVVPSVAAAAAGGALPRPSPNSSHLLLTPTRPRDVYASAAASVRRAHQSSAQPAPDVDMDFDADPSSDDYNHASQRHAHEPPPFSLGAPKHSPRHQSQPIISHYAPAFPRHPSTAPLHPDRSPPQLPTGHTPAMRSLLVASASASAVAPATNSPASSRVRTTPDAKRAQNRESAKRFRVAQKQRWAELQDTVAEKDGEIAKLKAMLQEVTETRLPSARRSSVNAEGDNGAASAAPADALVLGELDLLVKLMSAPKGDRGRPAPAQNTGHLHRILIATSDGTVTGVRHQQPFIGGSTADGGKVGQSLWDGVLDGDQLQLRFTVLHATRMGREMADEPVVFAYRRSIRLPDARAESKVRIKACVHPLMDESGNVTSLLLAEFIES